MWHICSPDLASKTLWTLSTSFFSDFLLGLAKKRPGRILAAGKRRPWNWFPLLFSQLLSLYSSFSFSIWFCLYDENHSSCETTLSYRSRPSQPEILLLLWRLSEQSSHGFLLFSSSKELYYSLLSSLNHAYTLADSSFTKLFLLTPVKFEICFLPEPWLIKLQFSTVWKKKWNKPGRCFASLCKPLIPFSLEISWPYHQSHTVELLFPLFLQLRLQHLSSGTGIRW